MSNFVHLHTHSEYSLLDGLSKIKKLVHKAKELGMEALAITDHGAMYGAIEFYKECKEQDIKPIIGCELYVAPRSHLSKEGKVDTEPYHLTVVAKNYQGYLNLMKLVSISHLEGFYYKPRVDKELLRKYSEGLIALSGCPAGEFIRALEESVDFSKAEKVAKEYLEIFGNENYYFELQNHFYSDILKNENLEEVIRTDLGRMAHLQSLTWEAAKRLSLKLGIPIVATNDSHYINKEDAEAQDCLICIQTGKQVADLQRLRMADTPNLYLKSAEEMAEAFKDLPQALESTIKIAEKCNLEIPMGKARFPIFEIPGNMDPMDYLRELTFERAKDRVELTEEALERLNYELKIIEKKNYPTYFLVVQDFITWANDQGIITNTRGSAAGSLVLFALGVTKINPLLYKIPFERFLNPERPSLPDIDADLADDRRDEVIRYVMNKYGEDKVAHIVTFGTMMGRAAIRDIGRVMGVPYGDVDRIAKLVPPPHQGFHKALADAIKEVPELAILYNTEPQYKKLLDLAVKVESTVRHASVHAAGIVIGPEALTNFAPLQRESNGDKVVTQYDMFAVEEVGLVKMDFLGIRNLSILGRAVEYVEKNIGTRVNLDAIPLDDEQSSFQSDLPPDGSKKTYQLLARGETMGVFQLSSTGMTKWLMDLKPKVITDLSAMVALYRPGPMGSIPDYIDRAHNPGKISYFDPRMKEYMSQSLGLLVYQEDVLLTAIHIAGYSWLEADKFRKAMGKKIPSEMAKQKDKFIKGAVEKGMTSKKADELWKLIEPFAAYGFPKAHAASYAIVAYQTAYMKANFPVEFMAAVMTAEYGDSDKIAEAIEECKKMGLVVLPPAVNSSGVGFTIERIDHLSPKELERQVGHLNNTAASEKNDLGNKLRQGIRFGLSAIKNVGISAIESILKARSNKPFVSMSDLCSRIDTRLANRKTLESLIKAGALDSFGTRASLLLGLDQCLEEAHKTSKALLSGQESLFGENEEIVAASGKLPEVDELPLDRLLTFEKELLGFYLHEPPFLKKLKQIEDFTSNSLSEIMEGGVAIGKRVVLGGVIEEVKRVMTKRSNQEMAFVRLSDGVLKIECVIFPKIYAEFKTDLEKEEVVLFTGKLDKRDEEYSLLVDQIEKFDDQTSVPNGGKMIARKEIEVEIPAGAGSDLLREVNNALRKYPGESPISILIPTGDTFKKMNLSFTVRASGDLIANMEKILGPNAVRINN